MKSPDSLKMEVMEEGELLPFKTRSGATAALFCSSLGCLRVPFAGEEMWPCPLARFVAFAGCFPNLASVLSDVLNFPGFMVRFPYFYVLLFYFAF